MELGYYKDWHGVITQYTKEPRHNRRLHESYEWLKGSSIPFVILTPVDFSVYVIMFKQEADLLIFRLKYGDVIKETLTNDLRLQLRYNDPWISFNNG